MVVEAVAHRLVRCGLPGERRPDGYPRGAQRGFSDGSGAPGRPGRATTESGIHWALALSVLGLLALLGSCSSDDKGSTSASEQVEPAAAVTTHQPEATVPTTTASTTTASTSTTESADLESNIESVLADRVRGYFDARASANAAPAPDPLSPGLAEYATGEELAAVVANTERRRDGGEAIRPGETALAEIRVAAGTVNGDSATVAACVIDDGVIFDIASGEVINDDVVTHNYQIELVLDGGVWKVARIVRVQQWEGVAGCALAPSDFPY